MPFDIYSRAGADAAFATAAQGELADTATQPGDLGTAAAADVADFATAAQGVKADTAVQPAALTTALNSGAVQAYVVQSKNLYNPADPGVQPGYTLSPLGVAVVLANYVTTGFVPVTGGQQYAYSNPRSVAFYDAAMVFVVGSSFDNPTMAAITRTAPATAKYTKASTLLATAPALQIEAGATSTAYVPYSRTLTGVTIDSVLPSITPDKTSFAIPSKNLVNPSEIQAGKLMSAPGSPLVDSATYSVTGYIPVKAGVTYALSNPRNIAFFNILKATIGSPGWTDVPGQTPSTITPAADGFIRASFNTADYTSNFQIEVGSASTAYVPYGFSMPYLNVALPGAMRVSRAGNSLSVTTDLAGEALTQTMNLAGSSNGAFNWQATTLAGTTRHAPSDSITPLRTAFGTVGANHGYSQLRTFTNPDGKTTADLGSKWTDGVTVYTLVQIDTAGKLVMGGPATGTGAGRTTAIVTPVADLTHVSGAAHTGTVLNSTIGGAYQLYPSIRAINVSATLDRGVIPDGDSNGSVLRIVESYEILDYQDLLAKMQTNIGQPYTALAVQGALRVSNIYEMTAPGVWLISTTVTALTAQQLGQCGFIQNEIMLTPAGGSVWRYIPGLKTMGGLTWHTGVDMTTYNVSQIVTSSDLIDTTKPPTWMTEFARDSGGNDILGFAHGYIPDKTNGSWASRVALSSTLYWDLRNTKKSYPNAVISKTLNPGEQISVESFRAYLSKAAPFGLAVQDAAGAYGFVRASSATVRPTPIPAQVGRSITTLAAQGVTVDNTVVDAEGIVVTGTGGAVVKLD